MLKSKLNQLREKDGFTIIEVIIVLVIAAIIMLAVFLVVPQLQRSQRNTRNQAVARQAFAAAEQYASQNNGSYPLGVSDIETITGSLKNASNSQFNLKANAYPLLATDFSMTNSAAPVAVACTSSSDGGSAWTGGTKFKIMITQETSASVTGGFFCLSN